MGEGEKARSRVEVEIKGLVEERRVLVEQMGEMQVRIEREEQEHQVRGVCVGSEGFRAERG